MKHTLFVAVACGLALLAPSSGLARVTTHPAKLPQKAAETAPVATGNPLLPAQVPLDGFFPSLTTVQLQPTIAPAGFYALYSPADWDKYRGQFEREADALAQKRSSGQLDFARKLIAAAETEKDRPGLQRLLLVRAVALAYRNPGGAPVAAQAITDYQQAMDLTVPADVAGLWTLADAMTKFATTPKPDRQRFSNLAAKADIQFTMLLLDAGQIDGAQKMMKALSRHDPATRADARLRLQALQTRNLVAESAEMMAYLAGQWEALNKGEASAAMPLYLYARFVKPEPDLARLILNRKGFSAVGNLEQLLAQAEHDPLATYAAGDALKSAGEALPEGVLKHRTLYAAWRYYHAFTESPATADQRVKRTLAGMAKQAVLSDGAHGPPAIKPFEAPPATGPAPTALATRAAP